MKTADGSHKMYFIYIYIRSLFSFFFFHRFLMIPSTLYDKINKPDLKAPENRKEICTIQGTTTTANCNLYSTVFGKINPGLLNHLNIEGWNCKTKDCGLTERSKVEFCLRYAALKVEYTQYSILKRAQLLNSWKVNWTDVCGDQVTWAGWASSC